MSGKMEMTELAQMKGIENLDPKQHMRLFEEIIGVPKNSLDAFEGLSQVFKADIASLENVVGRDAASDIKTLSTIGWVGIGERNDMRGIEETMSEHKNGMKFESISSKEKRDIREDNSIRQ